MAAKKALECNYTEPESADEKDEACQLAVPECNYAVPAFAANAEVWLSVEQVTESGARPVEGAGAVDGHHVLCSAPWFPLWLPLRVLRWGVGKE